MKDGNKVKKHQKIGIIAAFILVCVLIISYLLDFKITIRELERARGMEMLEDLAVQGATIAENKIKGVANVLRNTADFLEKIEDFQSDEVMEYLAKITFDEQKDIVTIGVSNEKGETKVTDGRNINVSEKIFFREAMEGREYVSTVIKREVGKIMVAVPIPGTDGGQKGVLYGIIKTEYFQLYADTNWDVAERDQYIHIIDRNGNYIVRSQNANSIIRGENFFVGIKELNPTVAVKKIKESVNGKEAILTRVCRGDDVRYVYFAPMDINNWCVVTVLTEKMIENQIAVSQEVVMALIVKLVVTLLAMGVLYYLVFAREKQEIKELNQELLLKDELFKIASSEVGNFIFTYDTNTRTLEFMNYDAKRLHIPRVIENFTEEFVKYVEKDSAEYLEIKRLLAAIDQGMDEVEGEIAIGQEEGETRIYWIQLVKVAKDDNKMRRMVGSLADITEEKEQELKLKKEAQIRSAVLSDTLGFFEVNLSKNCVMRDGVKREEPYTFTQILDRFVNLKVRDKDRAKVRDAFDVQNLLHMYEIGVYDTSLEYARVADNGEEVWVLCETHLEKDVVTDDIIALTVVWNIQEQKEHEIQLQSQVVYDPLTRSYNRGVGIDKINEILKENADMTHAMLLIDMDNFKEINDTFGHIMGDRVLINVVRILKQHIRAEDIVCRLGGDEFVVFLMGIPREAIHRNITKLLEKLRIEYSEGDIVKNVSASIGIAIAPISGRDFTALYEKADKALYEVKRNGRNAYKIYEEE